VVNAVPQFHEGQDEPYQVYASFEDITNLIEIQKALEKSERQNYLLVSKMQQGLAVYETILDQDDKPCDFRFLYVNKGFEKLTGLKKEQVIGKSVLEVLPNTESYWIENYGKVALTGEPIKFENYARDLGCYFSVVAYSPQPKQVAVIATNITEEKKKQLLLVKQKKELKTANDEMKTLNKEMEAVNEELAEREEEAIRASAAKSEFLANMSHELRTPLNGIIGFLQILKETELKAEQRDYIENVIFSSKNLIHIIEDILDYSKIEAGHFNIVYETTDLIELLNNSIQIIKPVAKKKGLEVNLSIDKTLSRFFQADALRLNQIFVNLLGNAVKFTESGKIDFDITVLEDHSNVSRITFSVTDTGIGIADGMEEKILQHFIQADYSITRKYGGTGLGLAITNSLLNMMGSSLIIKSKLDVGSCFSFILDLKKVSGNISRSKDIEAGLLKPAFNTEKKIVVLIAEDDPISLKLEVILLNRIFSNAIIFTATDGEAAIKIYRKNEPDIIFMDLHMPKMNGFEATEIIRGDEDGRKRVVIIGLSADAMQEKVDMAIEKEMDSYLTKPIKKIELLSVLSEFLT
jgi:PAS domain S-box-containing protein